MAQQNAIVNGTLSFKGAFAGQATLQAQPIGGNLTFQLPNIPPTNGQLISGTVNGNTVILGWANPQSLSNIPLSALAQSGATSGQVIEWNGSAWVASTTVPGAGTVTSVALTVPGSILAVGGSPITGAGTLAVTLQTQSPNQVWAGPVSGGAAAPAFRLLIAADLPLSALTTAANISATAATGINIVNSTSGDIDITQSGSGIVLISGPNSSSIRIASNGMLLTPGTSQATTIRSPRFTGEVLDNVNAGAAHTGQLLAADNTAGNLIWTDSVQVNSIAAVTSSDLTLSTSGSNKVRIAPATVVNISNVPGPYANNAAATGAGLVAGDVYYTQTDPRTLAVVF